MATNYVACIADAVGSRALAPKARARLQADLRGAVRDFNARYRKSLAARFAVTLGDELQALFTGPGAIWDLSHDLRHEFPHVDWVIAWGRGGLTTPLHRGAAAPELDGPCFHAARAALDRAKRRRQVLAFEGFHPLLDAFAQYYSALYWSWTPRQRRAANELRTRGESLLQLADRLGIVPSALSHLRRRMAWTLVAAGDRVFQELIAT